MENGYSTATSYQFLRLNLANPVVNATNLQVLDMDGVVSSEEIRSIGEKLTNLRELCVAVTLECLELDEFGSWNNLRQLTRLEYVH